MYIAEISPAQWRGRLVALNQLTIVLGILAGVLLAGKVDKWAWVGGVAVLLIVLALFGLPPGFPVLAAVLLAVFGALDEYTHDHTSKMNNAGWRLIGEHRLLMPIGGLVLALVQVLSWYGFFFIIAFDLGYAVFSSGKKDG